MRPFLIARNLVLAALLLLAGCGELPRPFAGHPGAAGARLAAPPPARLAVPPPLGLPPASAAMLARALTAQLVAQTVPAEAGAPRKGDWSLAVDVPPAPAGASPALVTPRFTVLDGQGRPHGAVSAPAVPEAAWRSGDPATLGLVAKTMAPRIASLLSTINLAERKADPHSLLNRSARVRLLPVTGAPGDGDTALYDQMSRELAALGPIVQSGAKGADFTVAGSVEVVSGTHGLDNVTIDWKVSDRRGLAGHVTQVNAVPHGTLAHAWGDNAVYAAHEAAAGVKQVIDRRIGLAVPGS
ncbi:MAG: hypothetical protein KGK10_02615 [Rhodospirillales bacterium]|nr:hypothetical protein [Rhodospirillales bacterium]